MFQASKVKTASRSTLQARQAVGLLSRLKDPQVWVCAIAAFTLVGLSSGLLGANDQQSPQAASQLMASAK